MEEMPTVVEQLLKEFQDVFREPIEFPPARSHYHSIPLPLGSKPVNLKPYRYTKDQEDIIERLVKEMLDSSIIQASYSPFSSPVLMVKKKDST